MDNCIIIDNIKFILTCSACPEQYDVYNDITKEKIGYVRLRHGMLTAEYKNVVILESSEFNDPFYGFFSTHEERMIYLTLIADKISLLELNKL